MSREEPWQRFVRQLGARPPRQLVPALGGARQRAKRNDPRNPPRVVDWELLRPVAGAVSLTEVVQVRFGAEAHAPLRGLSAEALRQRLEVRAERVPTPPPALHAVVEFTYTGTRKDEDIVTASGAFLLSYRLSPPAGEPFDEAVLDLFAEVNGVYHAWTYLRELVSSCTARLGLTDALLPVWQLPSLLPPRGEWQVVEITPAG